MSLRNNGQPSTPGPWGAIDSIDKNAPIALVLEAYQCDRWHGTTGVSQNSLRSYFTNGYKRLAGPIGKIGIAWSSRADRDRVLVESVTAIFRVLGRFALVASDNSGFQKGPKDDASIATARSPLPLRSRGWDEVDSQTQQSAVTSRQSWPIAGGLHAGVTIVTAGLILLAASTSMSHAALIGVSCGLLLAMILVHFSLAQSQLVGQRINTLLRDPVYETLDAIPDGLVVTDHQNRIVLVNVSFAAGVGLPRKRLVDQSIDSLRWIFGGASAKADMPWVQAARNAQTPKHQLLRYQHPDGDERIFSVSARPMAMGADEAIGALSTFADVTQTETYRAEVEHMLTVVRSSRDEMRSINRRLQVLADEDSLTRCLNRRSLFERVLKIWRDPYQSDHPMSCLMLDVDHFKQVNDDHGHQTGDDVLRTVAIVLKKSFPSPALVARYGGEEFCVIMPGVPLRVAVEQAEQARQKVEQARFLDQKDLTVTISIGASSRSKEMKQIEDLIRKADECLYEAKGNGRNQVIS